MRILAFVSIVSCELRCSTGIGTPGAQHSNVCLCTEDRDLRLRGLGEGLRVLDPKDLSIFEW